MLPRMTPWISLPLSLALGCGDSAMSAVVPGDGDETTEGSSSTTGAPETLDTSTGSSSADDDQVDTGFDPPEPECGNGFVEPGEQCDDGNDIDDDDCNNECLIPCGLEWEQLELPPTGESTLSGVLVARDASDAIVTAGRLREITTDEAGMQTQGPHEVLLVRHDGDGTKQWDARISLGSGHTRLGGLAVDPSGDVYVALTVDSAEGGSDIVVSKRARDDGSELWQHVHDSQVDSSVDLATGIAATDDGDIVVSGTVRAGAMDDDVWVRKLHGASGDEVWTTTWSGPGDDTFSSDRGGPVAVGPSGAVYVLAREHVDYATAPVLVLRASEAGGELERWFTPQYEGQVQIFVAVDLAVDSEDNVHLAVERTTFTGIDFWVHKVDAAGVQSWQRSRDDYREGGSGWRLVGLALHQGSAVLVGRYRNEDAQQQLEWSELWLRRLDPAGQLTCALQYRAAAQGLIPPSLFAEGGATRSDGAAIVTGMHESGDEVALWLATFRPT